MPIPNFKVVLLGSQQTGKSSLLAELTGNKASKESYEPTIGVSYDSKTYKIDQTLAKLQFWDTAGQERYYSLTRFYITGSYAALITLDLKKEQSIEKAQDYLKLIKRQNPKAKIQIIATSDNDKSDAFTTEEQQQLQPLKECYQSHYPDEPFTAIKINPFESAHIERLKSLLIESIKPSLIIINEQQRASYNQTLVNLSELIKATQNLQQKITNLEFVGSTQANNKAEILKPFVQKINQAIEVFDSNYNMDLLKKTLCDAVKEIKPHYKTLANHRHPVYQSLKNSFLAVLAIATCIISLPVAGIYYGITGKNPMRFFSNTDTINKLENTEQVINKLTLSLES